MKILIVEDELVLAHAMREMLLLEGYADVLIEHRFEPAKLLIEGKAIDLAILDINLGMGDEGIVLADICSLKKIPFIFTTSYSDKATLDKALITKPGAYLIKPITESSLYAALRIVLAQYEANSENVIVEFKDGTQIIKLPLKQILYLRSENIYVNVVTESRTYLYRGSLSSMLAKVPTSRLIQTHRAYAVNTMHVNQIGSNHVIVAGHELPVSRNYRSNISKV